MKAFCIILSFVLVVWPSCLTNRGGQTTPCFVQSNTWQLYSYRDNLCDTEFIIPFYGFTSRLDTRERIEMILQFDYNSVENIGAIKGHSLVNRLKGKFTYSNDSIRTISLMSISCVKGPPWGTDSLLAVFNNYSSYSCDGDSLYINYRNDSRSAVFSKVDKLQNSFFTDTLSPLKYRKKE